MASITNYVSPEKTVAGGAQPIFKYPASLGSAPYEKWILFEVRTGRHIGRTGMNMEGQPVDRTLASAALYLPTGALSSMQTISWQEEEYGAAVGAALESAYQKGKAPEGGSPTSGGGGIAGILSGIKSGGGAGVATKSIQTISEGIGKLNQSLGVEGASSTAPIEAVLGKTVNPRTDVFFKNVTYREHRMAFKLIPHTYDEAWAISNILNVFHYYSLPSYGGSAEGSSFFIGYPYEFVITMFTQVTGGQHHINTIDRSVLTSIEVDHAAGQQVAFVDRRGDVQYFPAVTSLELNFKEVRLRGRDLDTDGRNPIFRGTNNTLPTNLGEDPRLKHDDDSTVATLAAGAVGIAVAGATAGAVQNLAETAAR